MGAGNKIDYRTCSPNKYNNSNWQNANSNNQSHFYNGSGPNFQNDEMNGMIGNVNLNVNGIRNSQSHSQRMHNLAPGTNSRPTSGYDSFTGNDSIPEYPNDSRPSSQAWSEPFAARNSYSTSTSCMQSGNMNTLSSLNSPSILTSPHTPTNLNNTSTTTNSVTSSNHQMYPSTSTTHNMVGTMGGLGSFNNIDQPHTYTTTGSSHSGNGRHNGCFSISSSASVATTNPANLSTQSRPASGYDDNFEFMFCDFARPVPPQMRNPIPNYGIGAMPSYETTFDGRPISTTSNANSMAQFNYNHMHNMVTKSNAYIGPLFQQSNINNGNIDPPGVRNYNMLNSPGAPPDRPYSPVQPKNQYNISQNSGGHFIAGTGNSHLNINNSNRNSQNLPGLPSSTTQIPSQMNISNINSNKPHDNIKNPPPYQPTINGSSTKSDAFSDSANATQNSTDCNSAQFDSAGLNQMSQKMQILDIQNETNIGYNYNTITESANTTPQEIQIVNNNSNSERAADKNNSTTSPDMNDENNNNDENKSHTLRRRGEGGSIKYENETNNNATNTETKNGNGNQQTKVKENGNMENLQKKENPTTTNSSSNNKLMPKHAQKSHKSSSKSSKNLTKYSPVPAISKVPPAWYRFFIEQHMENMIKDHRSRRDRLLNLEKDMSAHNTKAEEREQIRSVLYTKESQCLRRKRQKLTTNDFTWIKTLGVGAFGEVALARHNETNEIFAIKKLKKTEIRKKKQTAHVKAERDILAEADTPWIPKLWYSFQDIEHLFFVTEYIPGGDLMSLLIKKEIFPENMGKFYIAEMVLALEYVHKIGYIHRDIKPDNILIDQYGHIKLADFGLCTGFRWTHDSYYYNEKNQHQASHAKENSNAVMGRGIEWEQQVASAHTKTTNDVDHTTPVAHGEVTRRHVGMNPDLEQIKEDGDLERGPEDKSGGGANTSTTSFLYPQEPTNITLEKEKAHTESLHKKIAHSLVGTPNYIAPEVLKQEGYTQNCDWWSVGVILFEMVIGMPPFYAHSALDTQKKIISWERCFRIPRYPEISPQCKDIINSWITHKQHRLSDILKIKKHEWFRMPHSSINWSNLRNELAPYTPIIKDVLDTRNFDEIPNDPYTNQYPYSNFMNGNGNGRNGPNGKAANGSKSNGPSNKEPYFADFTYKRIDVKDIPEEWRKGKYDRSVSSK